ncbi:MAG: hypothetical protein FWC47_10525 [Oscillospiraceae bacterium]|nr:hypothetical protein [Oscillospiraceae bacterium]
MKKLSPKVPIGMLFIIIGMIFMILNVTIFRPINFWLLAAEFVFIVIGVSILFRSRIKGKDE